MTGDGLARTGSAVAAAAWGATGVGSEGAAGAAAAAGLAFAAPLGTRGTGVSRACSAAMGVPATTALVLGMADRSLLSPDTRLTRDGKSTYAATASTSAARTTAAPMRIGKGTRANHDKPPREPGIGTERRACQVLSPACGRAGRGCTGGG